MDFRPQKLLIRCFCQLTLTQLILSAKYMRGEYKLSSLHNYMLRNNTEWLLLVCSVVDAYLVCCGPSALLLCRFNAILYCSAAMNDCQWLAKRIFFRFFIVRCCDKEWHGNRWFWTYKCWTRTQNRANSFAFSFPGTMSEILWKCSFSSKMHTCPETTQDWPIRGNVLRCVITTYEFVSTESIQWSLAEPISIRQREPHPLFMSASETK